MADEQAAAPAAQPVQYVYGGNTGNAGLGKWILGGLAVIYMAVTSYYLMDAHTRLAKAEKEQVAATATAETLAARINKGEAATQSVASQLGITEKQLSNRAEAIQKQQVASTTRLEKATADAEQKIGAVSGEVSSVKSDVAATKTDVASTKTALDATNKKLESTIGDLGLQSGLIAHTRDDLHRAAL